MSNPDDAERILDRRPVDLVVCALNGAGRYAHMNRAVLPLKTTCAVGRSSSYEGRYYSYDDAYVSPLPLQDARVPILIAAHGPRGIKLAAERGDTWNLFEPGAGLKGEEAAAAMKAKNAALDANAAAAGREPGQIRRSLYCGFSASTSWSTSDEALADIAIYERAGINEFILNYSPSGGFLSADRAADEHVPSVFLRSPEDLRDFAAAVGLDGPAGAR